MKKLSYLLMCCCLSFGCCDGQEQQAPTQETEEKVDLNFGTGLCSKETLMTFFPEPIVKAVLKKTDLPQDKIDAIAKELAQKDHDIVKAVQAKAAEMSTQFNDLSQREAAVKIFRETLHDQFAEVLKAHGITDQSKIQGLLDDIREAKGKLFVECIRKQQEESK